MPWKEKRALAGFLIWVAEYEQRWLASIPALPRRGGMYTVGPGDEVIPGEFSTEEFAEDGAKRYIVQKGSQ